MINALFMPSQQENQKVMSLTEHLDELRVRLMRRLIIFMVGFGICYFWTNAWVMDWLRAPLFSILPEEKRHLYFTHLFENFFAHLKIAAVSSLFVFSPLLFYQLWSFIAPGLYPRERKWVVPFLVAASGFFAGGAAFAYYVLFPVAFQFFVTFGSPSDTALLTIGAYIDVVLKLLLLFGLAFELPVLIVFLGFLGVLQSESLRKNRKTAIIGITIACALFAPPDAISMLILMAPLIALYEASILVVGFLQRGRPPKPTV